MTARRRTTPMTRLAGRATVLATSCALVAGLLVVLETTTAPVPAQAATAAVLERPDEVTAQMAARAQGSKVEVAGARTESRRVWANPDGSFTSEMFPGQNWTKDAAGNWQEIDTTLVRGTDGSVTPKAAAVEVTLAGPTPDQAGAVPVVTMEVAKSSLGELAAAHEDPSLEAPAADEAGTSVASLTLATQGGLAAPVLDGAQATYAGFEPGRDLRVTVLPGGVETFVDLAAAPASIPAEGVEVALPLSAKGLTVAEDGDGGLVIKDPKTGAVVGTTPQSRIWDASIDAVSGESEHGIVVDTQLRKTSTGYLVIATVPASYFATPGLTYPITVDPSATLPPSKDTYVEKGYNDTSFGGETDLKVGTYDSGTHVARSYLQFTLSDAANLYDTTDETTVVDTAKLKLWEWHAASCTASAMNIRYLTSAFTAADSTWNTKPTQSGAIYTVSDAHRDDSSGACAEGWFDTTSGTEVKSIVQGWADGDYTNYGFALTASETASSGWKRFYSGQYATASRRPSLVLSYHHKPKPTSLSISGRNAAGWVRSATPTLTGIPSDLDGGSVTERFEVSTSSAFTSTVWTGTKSVTSGLTATQATGTLTQGTQYYARAIAQQLFGATTESGPASAGLAFKVDSVAPALTVSCTGPTKDQYVPNPPTGDVPCTVTATEATSGVATFSSITLDGLPSNVMNLAGTGGSRSFDLKQSAVGTGWHVVSATVTDNAGNTTTQTFAFGIGTAQMSLPADEQTTSSGTAVLEVSSGSGVSTYVQYSTDGTTWTTIPASQLTSLAGSAVTTPLALSGTGMLKSAPVRWSMVSAFNSDTVVSIRPCVVPAAGQACVPPTTGDPKTLTLDRSGAGAASTSVGPISVALTTGAATLGATDAAVGGASVGRSYSSFSPNVDGPFGKGWTTALGSAAGTDWSHLVDTGTGLLLYASTDGDPISFATAETAAGCSASYLPVDDTTGLEVCKRLVSGATTFTLTETGGTSIDFALQTGATYIANVVTDPITGQATDFDADGSGITRVLPPLPPGTTCPANTSLWEAGCSDLLVSYASSRVSTITWRGYEQPLNGTSPVLHSYDVACYRYDSNGRLTQVWDPRDNTAGYAACGSGAAPFGALVKEYGYDSSSGRLTSVTPPGRQPWTITYNATSGKTTAISRTHTPDFNGGATETTTIQYDAPIGSATSGDDSHPDLTASAVAAWWPIDPAIVSVTAPVYATAVYPPGASTSDLRNATVTAMDEFGRAVMTAGFSGTGQAGWKVSTQVLDPITGAVRASLAPGNREAALNPASPLRTDVSLTGTTAEAARMLASTTAYTNLVDDNGDTIIDTDDIADATDTYGPLHVVDVAGAPVAVRSHTRTTYGDLPAGTVPDAATDRATKAQVHAVLQITEAGWDPSTGADIASTVQTTKYAYAYTVGGTETQAGWTLSTPVQVTVVNPGGTDIVTRTLLEPDTGQVLQTRQPSAKDDSIAYDINGTPLASDPGTRLTRTWAKGNYNAANCTATVWYGLPCDAKPASGNVPAATQTFYDLFGRAIKQVDTGTSSMTRTTSTNYANSGLSSRATTVTTTGGATGDTAVPDKSIAYNTATGLPTGITAGTGGNAITTTTSYDDFGRPLTATDGTGGQTIATYENTTGRVSTVTRTQNSTAVGTTTYTYNGGSERRGLPTSATHTTLGTIAATYDADGQPTAQTIPMVTGTLTQSWTRSSLGQPLEMNWTRSGIGDPWVTNTTTIDSGGRVITDTSTLYAVGGRVRDYTYDPAGRLTTVTDTREAACTTRTYGFDVNGNRTTNATYAPDTYGSCQTTTATASTTNDFTAADQPYQPNGGTLAYDTFARTTKLPAAHTALPSAGDVTVTYYANDLVRSTAAAGANPATSTWTLDASDRLACRRDKPTATTDATSCGATSTIGVVDTINHYDGGSDSPAWTITRTGGTTPTSTTAWYVPGLAGGLTATVTGSTATIALADLHGDVPLTVATTETVAPAASPTDTDEYGVVRDTNGNPTTGPRYAYLGTAQRDATAAAGLTLMGVRLYNASTGRFLSTDPVYGGNTSTYGYPTDPVNRSDSSGRCWSWVPDGVCGLWNSFRAEAWACSATGFGCAYAASVSKFVQRWAGGRFPGRAQEPVRNAARHYVWQIMLMWGIGSRGALIWAYAHEMDAGSSMIERVDASVDWYNNGVAWRTGWYVQATTSYWGAWAFAMARLRTALTYHWLKCRNLDTGKVWMC